MPALKRLASPVSLLETLEDLATIAIIFLAPLFMGGRNDLGRLVYVVAVAVLVCSWVGRQYLCGNTVWWKVRGGWLLIGGLALVCFQLWPLAPELLSRISAGQGDLLNLWQSHDGQPALIQQWQSVSLAPRETKIGLVVYFAHLSLFLVTVQRLADLDRIERLLRWVALGVLSMAVFAFVQYVSGTPKFAWFFRHPSRDANWYMCGPFANSNHFAHFLALGIGPLIWWLQKLGVGSEAGPTGNRFYNSKHRERDLFARLMILFACGVLAIAGLLSLSRGGMLAMALAGFIAVGLYVLTGVIGKRVLLALTAVCVLVMAGLYLHGADVVSQELGSLTAGSIDELDESQGRRRIWAANLEVAKTFPILGAGVGTHAEIYQKFFPHRSRVEFTHAESSYLNLLSETGIVGLGLALAAVFICLRWCWGILRGATSVRVGTCGIAVTASLVASVFHSVWDFVWYIGGCMSLTLLIAACACRLAGDHVRKRANSPADDQRQINSFAWLLAGVATVSIFVGCTWIQWGPAMAASHWNDYLRLSLANRETLKQVYAKKGALASPDTDERRYSNLKQMHRSLAAVLRHDPGHFRAQLRMSAVLTKSFDLLQRNSANAMSYVQIRDAVWASEFPTLAAQDEWLQRAIGPNIEILRAALTHAVTGVHACPLLGRGYIRWADLAFLQGHKRELTRVLLAQAERVRPYDGAVLFNLGRESAFGGEALAALEYWKKAFHLDAQYRNAVMQALAPRMPATAFVQHFQPNPEEIETLFHFYRVTGAMDDARTLAPVLGQHLSELAESQATNEAMLTWLKCVDVYRFVGDGPSAVTAAEQGVASNPNNFDMRVVLANQLTKEQRFAEAETHWLWCVRRHPQDQSLQRQLKRIRLARVASPQVLQTSASSRLE